MYEWSKSIIEKISNANCLDARELRQVEIALRINEIYGQVLDECIGLTDEDKYELKYRMDTMHTRIK